MSYRLQKNLALLALYATAVIITSVAVGDLSRGFGLATAGCIVGYAVLEKLSKL